MIKKEILPDLDRDDLTPPSYWIMTRLPPSAPSGLEATLMPNPEPGEVPAAATDLPPALPEFVEPPFWQAPIPVTEASGQHFQDPAENRQETVQGAALGKSISGPPENLICPRDKTVLQPVPTEAMGPVTVKPVCPVPSFWPLEG